MSYSSKKPILLSKFVFWLYQPRKFHTFISLGNRFASFQGIRYAQPPIGDLRFKSPQPFIGQNLTLDVSGKSNISCPQIGSTGLLQDSSNIEQEIAVLKVSNL